MGYFVYCKQLSSRAWQTSKSNKWYYWKFILLASIAIQLTMYAANTMLDVYFPDQLAKDSIVRTLLVAMPGSVLFSPLFIVAYWQISIYRARTGFNLGFGIIKTAYKRFLPLTVITLITSSIVLVPTFLIFSLFGVNYMIIMLLMLPISLFFIMAAPLCLDKNLGVHNALHTSFLTIQQNYLGIVFVVFLAQIVFLVLMVLSIFTLGIGAIWLLPWFLQYFGYLYCDLFDQALATQSDLGSAR